MDNVLAKHIRHLEEPWESHHFPYKGLWSEQDKFDSTFRIVEVFKPEKSDLEYVLVEFTNGEFRTFTKCHVEFLNQKNNLKIDWSLYEH